MSAGDFEEFFELEFVAKLLEVGAGIFGDGKGLEVVSEVFGEGAFAGGFWTKDADAFEVVLSYVWGNEVPMGVAIISDGCATDGHDTAVWIYGDEASAEDFGEFMAIGFGGEDDVRWTRGDFEEFPLPDVPKVWVFGGFLGQVFIEVNDITVVENFAHPLIAKISGDGFSWDCSDDDGEVVDVVAGEVAEVNVPTVRWEKFSKKEAVLDLIHGVVRSVCMRFRKGIK